MIGALSNEKPTQCLYHVYTSLSTKATVARTIWKGEKAEWSKEQFWKVT